MRVPSPRFRLFDRPFAPASSLARIALGLTPASTLFFAAA